MLAAYFTNVDDVLTASEARAAKRHKHGLQEISQWWMVSGQPTLNMFHIWDAFFKI